VHICIHIHVYVCLLVYIITCREDIRIGNGIIFQIFIEIEKASINCVNCN
jgi:hypothetical protein